MTELTPEQKLAKVKAILNQLEIEMHACREILRGEKS
jgi:hypothetical protein